MSTRKKESQAVETVGPTLVPSHLDSNSLISVASLLVSLVAIVCAVAALVSVAGCRAEPVPTDHLVEWRPTDADFLKATVSEDPTLLKRWIIVETDNGEYLGAPRKVWYCVRFYSKDERLVSDRYLERRVDRHWGILWHEIEKHRRRGDAQIVVDRYRT